MLYTFRDIETDTQGNLVVRYEDEAKKEHSFAISSGAIGVTITALIAQANKMPCSVKSIGQPIRAANAGAAVGPDGSAGLAFHLVAGYVFPIFFSPALIPKVRQALLETEQMTARPPDRPS
jgi:hypothetical protein